MMKNLIPYLLSGFFLVMSLSACKKNDISVADGQEAYINFYNASEVLQQNSAYSSENFIINNSFSKQPVFSSIDDFRQFPRHLTASDRVVDVIYPPAGITYDVVYWLPLTANTYQFAYTSVDKTVIADTSINVSPQSFTTQYLVESPLADHTYQTVTVPVERKGTKGKVRLQIINLSPDFGPLEVYQTDLSGKRISTELPASLPFGKYSNYVELDTAGAGSAFGKILLNFRKSGTDARILSKAIDAVSNSVFTLVFQGFEKNTSRRIKTGENTYGQVTVTANLRINTRRVY